MYARKPDGGAGAFDTRRDWQKVPKGEIKRAFSEIAYDLYAAKDFRDYAVVVRDVHRNGNDIKLYAILLSGYYVRKNITLEEAADYFKQEVNRMRGQIADEDRKLCGGRS